MKSSLIVFILVLQSVIVFSQKSTEVLNKTLSNLENINTASYFSKSSFSAPGDTTKFHSYSSYKKIFMDEKDSVYPANVYSFLPGDTNKLEYSFDGQLRTDINWKTQTATFDTVNRKSGVMLPFFIKTKSLIHYALENREDVKIHLTNYQDSIKIDFLFPEMMVEFVGIEPFVKESENNSSYTIWVDPQTFLPFKYIRKMPHQSSWNKIHDISINEELNIKKNIQVYIPANFDIRSNENNRLNPKEMEGRKAPLFTLEGIYGDTISLNQIKSKVLLIQFTGVGCGACHASIPFLNRLSSEFSSKKFELICIENWSSNKSGLKRYAKQNDIDFKFLISSKNLGKNYKVPAVPVFFIINKKHIIEKVILGYKKGDTDEKIRQILEEMI